MDRGIAVMAFLRKESGGKKRERVREVDGEREGREMEKMAKAPLPSPPPLSCKFKCTDVTFPANLNVRRWTDTRHTKTWAGPKHPSGSGSGRRDGRDAQ